MGSSLNDIEKNLLDAIVEENSKELPFLKNHLNCIYVKNRENTGVGFYINFGYKNDIKNENINTIISSDKILKIKGFENEVSYVLDIANGYINHLEIVTNGNDFFLKDINDYEFELI